MWKKERKKERKKETEAMKKSGKNKKIERLRYREIEIKRERER